MQTQLTDAIKNTPHGQEADSILRACVHCGFCTATCPTYQLLGDELDGPRGRIYLIKEMLEGNAVTRKTQIHLDRCLTCRACETTCPSGVQYGRLVDIGRVVAEQRVQRPWQERVVRKLLRMIIPYPHRFTPLLRLGQSVRPLLPKAWRHSIPPRRDAPVPQEGHSSASGNGSLRCATSDIHAVVCAHRTRPSMDIAGSPHRTAFELSPSVSVWPAPRHQRRMLVLDGCVQPAIAPNINAAAARVLDRLGISLLRADKAGCCGAVSYHLNAHDEGLDFMRRNIDVWWPHIQAGVEAIVMTASGCGTLVKDYGHILRHDTEYAAKAARVSALSRDLGEVLAAEDLAVLHPDPVAKLSLNQLKTNKKIAFHAPCSLQHAQRLPGLVEKTLQACGFELAPVPDAHLCCGSAGTYAMLQKDLSRQLLHNKLEALQSGAPDVIATANIGCLTHLQSRSGVPVRHWIELMDEI